MLCVALLVVGTDNLITKSLAVAPAEQAALAPPVIEVGSTSVGISVADCATCPNGQCNYIVNQAQPEQQQVAEQGEARQGGPLRRVARAKPARRVLGLVGRLVRRR